MEKENTGLYQEVQENVAAQNRADDKTAEIFAFFDEVWHRVLRLWQYYRLGTDQYGIIGCCFHTDLRQVEGTSSGGYASVDALDCRDSERY
jgi:hypothetical protein